MSDLQIGTFIAHLRKEKGMTQKELAQQLNLSDKAISKWERGESYPEITILPKLSALLEVSADELLAGQRKKLEETDECSKCEAKEQQPSILGRRILSYMVDSLLAVFLMLGIILIQSAFLSNSAYAADVHGMSFGYYND